MDPQQIDVDMRRAQAEFHQLITSASPENLRRRTDGTRWTNRQLLFHMVLGSESSGHCFPWCGRWGASVIAADSPPPSTQVAAHSTGSTTSAPALLRDCCPPRAITALFDRTIGSLRRRLAVETERNLTLSMHMPTGWDPYFAPTMSVLDVYRFGTQHFDHHRRQLALPEPQAQP